MGRGNNVLLWDRYPNGGLAFDRGSHVWLNLGALFETVRAGTEVPIKQPYYLLGRLSPEV